MKTVGNLLWLIFGGFATSLEYFIAGTIMMVTIIGIPFGLQAFKLGILALWPFGTEIKIKPGNPGCISTIMNLLWFFVGGIWIAITHLLFGLLLIVTIVGIPFGVQHFKLASLALTPFGREVAI